MKTNYHTHTYRCNHAEGTEEDYCIQAINNGLHTLGFSDHAPFKDYDYALRMQFCELNEHLQILDKLRDKYKDKIIIKKGLEIEYQVKSIAYYDKLLTHYNLDYLILGQHFYTLQNNEFYNTYNLDRTSEYIDYAKSLSEAMKTGYFKYVAHPDVVFINDLKWDRNCDKTTHIIIDNALKYNTILEFNANGIRRGKKKFIDGERFLYPHMNFWKEVAKTNIKVIVGSDCHNPSDLWDNHMIFTIQMAKDLGLNTIADIFD